MSKQPLDVRRLFPEVDWISDAGLRDKIVHLWQDLWRESSYQSIEDVPVAANIHYSQLKHCQGILRAAIAAARAWEEVHGVAYNMDHLIAGALLMDVSKLVEIQPDRDGSAVASEIGRLLPHAFYAAHRALEVGVPLPIVHIMTAHSPNGGKSPVTPEALLLHWIDQADIAAFGHDIWSRKVVHYQP